MVGYFIVQPSFVLSFLGSATSAGASLADLQRDLATGDLLARLDHLHHRVAVAGPDVEDLAGGGGRRLDREPVRRGEIGGVHVVANAGAVGRRVVGAEDLQRIHPALSDPQHQRNEVGLGIVVLAVRTVGVGAGGVEVAKQREPESVGLREVADHPLDGELGPGVGAAGHLLGLLAHGHLGVEAVGRTRAREEHPVDVRLAHRRQQAERADDVVAVVVVGVGHRLADVGRRGEVHHRLDAVVLHDRGELRGVGEVAHHETIRGHRVAMAEAEVVVGDGVGAFGDQVAKAGGPDESGAAGDEDLHGRAPGSIIGRSGTRIHSARGDGLLAVEQQFDGAGQVGGDEGAGRHRVLGDSRPLSGPDEDRTPASRPSSRLEIGEGVADHPASRQIEVELGGGAVQHAGIGLSVGMGRRAVGRGNVWVPIDGVETRLGACRLPKERLEMLVDGPEAFGGQHASSHHRLVGRKHRKASRRPQAGHRLGGALDESDVLDPMQMVDVLDDRAVAVEEDRRATHDRLPATWPAARSSSACRSDSGVPMSRW